MGWEIIVFCGLLFVWTFYGVWVVEDMSRRLREKEAKIVQLRQEIETLTRQLSLMTGDDYD